jgi:histidine triad (HIT) family protein
MTATATPAYDPSNVFARILRGELPCEKVYEDDVALALMDIMPRGDGHVLVIPKVAARGLLDIPPGDLAALVTRVQTVARAVKAGMQAEGLTIQQFNEQAGGQVVFHLHFHILPRWDGVPLKPHSGAMEDPDVLRRHADRIRSALR